MCEDLANPSQRGGHEENAATFPRAGNLGLRASEPPIEEGCRGHDMQKLFLEVPEEVNARKIFLVGWRFLNCWCFLDQ